MKNKIVVEVIIGVVLIISSGFAISGQLSAVKENGWAIKDIDNPSKEIQIAAVKQNAAVLKHIKNPSEETQLVAVKGNAWAIKYIENPSKEVQLAAVKQVP